MPVTSPARRAGTVATAAPSTRIKAVAERHVFAGRAVCFWLYGRTRRIAMSNQSADRYPHAPDVAERQTVDNGFSAGWGCQYLPSERYIVDVHTHCFGATDRYEIFRMLDGFFSRAAAFRLGRMVALDGSPENLESFAALARFDPRFRFWVRGDDEKPDLDFVKKAVDAGAVGMKILNIRIMRKAGDHKAWLSRPWQEIFAWLEGRKLPVLWHVTQRHTAAPYMGGNLLSYWSEGWKNGATFTNEDLLQVFLDNVKRFRGIPFIGAHQLHIGWDRLGQIFAEHPNLSVDTSCGCIIRPTDQMDEQDRRKLNEFFRKWQDRILFGTDVCLEPGCIDEYLLQHLINHIRFIHQLRLPDDVLQAVTNANAEKLLRLQPLSDLRRGALRP
jgi:predicted TIM-barrel fold metal-dependent hydrolase